MKKTIYILFICFSFSTNFSFAHSGGHFHKGELVSLNTWSLNSGKTIKGNFSFAKDNTIFLEQEEGRIIAVQISDLSIQDQRLAKWKIDKLNDINLSMPVNTFPETNHTLKYLPLCLLCISLIGLFFLHQQFLKTYILNTRLGLSTCSFLLVVALFIACSKSTISTTNTPSNPVINNPSNPVVVVIPKTNTASIDSAFAAFKPAISTSWDDTYLYIASNGIPSHNMMVGITNWQQQVPISQPYIGTNSWSIPLQPAYATIPLSTKTNLLKGAVAVAVNGIPIFNALNNRGEDAYKIGELDNWGGHCGRADDYHYHAAPLHLAATNGLKPIAYAVDGFAVFGSKEPDGSNMMTLDTCHGHTVSNGVYHYHGTTDYPYVVGAMKGKVNLDPATTAPENQVIPQAFTKAVRPATSPLSGAMITDFTAVGTNGYLLTYKRGTKNGYIKYSWDASNKYTFILTDTAGVAVTNVYQR
jgi:hypothetical protein